MNVFDLPNEVQEKNEGILCDQPEKPRDKSRPFRYYSDSELEQLWKIYRGETNIADYNYFEYTEIKKEIERRLKQ